MSDIIFVIYLIILVICISVVVCQLPVDILLL